MPDNPAIAAIAQSAQPQAPEAAPQVDPAQMGYVPSLIDTILQKERAKGENFHNFQRGVVEQMHAATMRGEPEWFDDPTYQGQIKAAKLDPLAPSFQHTAAMNRDIAQSLHIAPMLLGAWMQAGAKPGELMQMQALAGEEPGAPQGGGGEGGGAVTPSPAPQGQTAYAGPVDLAAEDVRPLTGKEKLQLFSGRGGKMNLGDVTVSGAAELPSRGQFSVPGIMQSWGVEPTTGTTIMNGKRVAISDAKMTQLTALANQKLMQLKGGTAQVEAVGRGVGKNITASGNLEDMQTVARVLGITVDEARKMQAAIAATPPGQVVQPPPEMAGAEAQPGAAPQQPQAQNPLQDIPVDEPTRKRLEGFNTALNSIQQLREGFTKLPNKIPPQIADRLRLELGNIIRNAAGDPDLKTYKGMASIIGVSLGLAQGEGKQGLASMLGVNLSEIPNESIPRATGLAQLENLERRMTTNKNQFMQSMRGGLSTAAQRVPLVGDGEAGAPGGAAPAVLPSDIRAKALERLRASRASQARQAGAEGTQRAR